MLYNITPPNNETQIEPQLDKMRKIIEKTNDTIEAIGIYDIIPEDITNMNTNTCRPFPIKTYINTFTYAEHIKDLLLTYCSL